MNTPTQHYGHKTSQYRFVQKLRALEGSNYKTLDLVPEQRFKLKVEKESQIWEVSLHSLEEYQKCSIGCLRGQQLELTLEDSD